MDRRVFMRLVAIGVAAGPEAIREAMKPRVFYSIPAPATSDWWARMTGPISWDHVYTSYPPIESMLGRLATLPESTVILPHALRERLLADMKGWCEEADRLRG